MNLKVSFLWIGLVVFALPMLINIAYLFAVTLIVSRDKLSFRSGWLYLAAAFLCCISCVPLSGCITFRLRS